MGIATNKVKSAADKLNEIYFEGLIDEVAGVEDGIIPKPDRCMIDNLMKRLNATTDETLYVGDSQVDVATARNTGLDMWRYSGDSGQEKNLRNQVPWYLLMIPWKF